MAGQGPDVRRVAAAGAARSRRAAGLSPWVSAFVALALAAAVPEYAGAQMTPDTWSTDPATASLIPGRAAHARSGPEFPLPVYSAIGSSMVRTGPFATLGWDEDRIAAFVGGMRAAFQGKPVPLDEATQQSLSAMARRTAVPGPTQAGPTFSVAQCGALGSFLALSGHLPELGWNEGQVGAFLDGMRAALQGRPFPLDEKARQLLSDVSRQIADIEGFRRLEAPSSLDAAGRLNWYMEKVRRHLGLQQSDSGLAYRIERGHGGIRPRPGDTVVLTCSAVAADGTTKLPQLSGERFRVKMGQLLPGLREGLQMMTPDGSAVFVLPPGLSFAGNPWPDGVERGAPIIFTVTLHEVIDTEASP
jgi:FKBP-type peptidyl-prolyl cis-trans isomerase